MQDAITTVITKYDTLGSYLDQFARNQLGTYFDTGIKRIQITEVINSKANIIIKEASGQLFEEQPELLRPGGNSYTTRRYAACLRDIEYYLRYASYSLIAGDTSILLEKVLNGLRETYNSLNVPLAPTVRIIQLLQDVIEEEVLAQRISDKNIVAEPFQFMIKTLIE
uniref:Allophycocyanin beta 18 subunit n=1 Tax=Apophlaea sinclairii TaxID=212746 RepID=A0A1C9CBH7_9FLOR|nr:allophycocyanin beta 18 subunit [Apophlaea sinclairii]AOM65753.1 allophycocyanin beta 18 subunit [Apophlaea sinclairii]